MFSVWVCVCVLTDVAIFSNKSRFAPTHLFTSGLYYSTDSVIFTVISQTHYTHKQKEQWSKGRSRSSRGSGVSSVVSVSRTRVTCTLAADLSTEARAHLYASLVDPSPRFSNVIVFQMQRLVALLYKTYPKLSENKTPSTLPPIRSTPKKQLHQYQMTDKRRGTKTSWFTGHVIVLKMRNFQNIKESDAWMESNIWRNAWKRTCLVTYMPTNHTLLLLITVKPFIITADYSLIILLMIPKTEEKIN